MIFDDPRLVEKLDNFALTPDFYVPDIVGLARWDEASGERKTLEDIFSEIPQNKQADLLGRLFDNDHKQHLGAWFEIRLFDWLMKAGGVTWEPELKDKRPDFLLKAQDENILVEAIAWSIPDHERQLDNWRQQIYVVLRSIQMPYTLSITDIHLETPPDCKKIKRSVEEWLTRSPETPHEVDDNNNHIELSVVDELSMQEQDHILIASLDSIGTVDPNLMRQSLKNKAGRYKNFLDDNSKYCIAFFIESPFYSKVEVVKAWLGNSQAYYDQKSQKLIKGNDLNGLHYGPNGIVHKSVSCTLAFERRYDKKTKGWKLIGYFIQNPFTTRSINPDIFPADDAFVVVDKTDENFNMAWRSGLHYY